MIEEDDADELHQKWIDHVSKLCEGVGVDPASIDWDPAETDEETIGHICGQVRDKIVWRMRELVRPQVMQTERCGFVPPTPGYAPCTRDKGHNGPCAHPLSLAPGSMIPCEAGAERLVNNPPPSRPERVGPATPPPVGERVIYIECGNIACRKAFPVRPGEPIRCPKCGTAWSYMIATVVD